MGVYIIRTAPPSLYSVTRPRRQEQFICERQQELVDVGVFAAAVLKHEGFVVSVLVEEPVRTFPKGGFRHVSVVWVEPATQVSLRWHTEQTEVLGPECAVVEVDAVGQRQQTGRGQRLDTL